MTRRGFIHYNDLVKLEGALDSELARDMPRPDIPGLGRLVLMYTTNLEQAGRLARKLGNDQRAVEMLNSNGAADNLTTTHFTRFLAEKLGRSARSLWGRDRLRIFFSTVYAPANAVSVSYQTLQPDGRGPITGTLFKVNVLGDPANEINVDPDIYMRPLTVDITAMGGAVEALTADARVACRENLGRVKSGDF